MDYKLDSMKLNTWGSFVQYGKRRQLRSYGQPHHCNPIVVALCDLSCEPSRCLLQVPELQPGAAASVSDEGPGGGYYQPLADLLCGTGPCR